MSQQLYVGRVIRVVTVQAKAKTKVGKKTIEVAGPNKSVWATAEVYGRLDPTNPTVLIRRQPTLVDFHLALDHPLAQELAKRDVLCFPAKGIAAEGKPVEFKRGTQTVFEFRGLDAAKVTLLNEQKLQDEEAMAVRDEQGQVVAKESKVLQGANDGLMSWLGKLAKAALR